jgi:predicted DNA-binding protein with PD1-like motif
MSTESRLHARRLLPGQDLRAEIERLARETPIRAGVVLSGVGSLVSLALRFANGKEAATRTGHFEIVSLTGTVGADGAHLHLAASDETGITIGGHVLPGCVVFTTVELVIGEASGLIFHRAHDPGTGFQELLIQRSR